ncbi:MAG: AtpZ/AtpI family protein, partial [Proteobacteria bacterium]|nr:AtpZ/AtpI family protein [Pseudomonadota bacterium]
PNSQLPTPIDKRNKRYHNPSGFLYLSLVLVVMSDNSKELQQLSDDAQNVQTGAKNSESNPEDVYLWDDKDEEDDFVVRTEDEAANADSSADETSDSTGHDDGFLHNFRNTIPKRPESDPEQQKRIRNESYKILANVGNIGLFFLVAMVICYVIGKACDGFFGTKPVLTIVWIGFGIAATIREMVRIISDAKKLGESKDNKPL